jgi:hypothetical protein
MTASTTGSINFTTGVRCLYFMRSLAMKYHDTPSLLPRGRLRTEINAQTKSRKNRLLLWLCIRVAPYVSANNFPANGMPFALEHLKSCIFEAASIMLLLHRGLLSSVKMILICTLSLNQCAPCFNVGASAHDVPNSLANLPASEDTESATKAQR